MTKSNKKKILKPEQAVSFEKTKVDLDRIPPWIHFTSYLKRLFGFSAGTYEYHDVYDIYSRKKPTHSLTETFLVGFVIILFIFILFATIYVIYKAYMGPNPHAKLLKDIIKATNELEQPATNPIFKDINNNSTNDRLVRDITVGSTTYKHTELDHKTGNTQGFLKDPTTDMSLQSYGKGPQEQDYQRYFDFNAFAFAEPGGGLIPPLKKTCISVKSLTGGSQQQGPVGPRGPEGPRGPTGYSNQVTWDPRIGAETVTSI